MTSRPPARTPAKNLQIAELLLDLYRGRDDVIAIGDSNGMRCKRINRPLTSRKVAALHLEGKTCYGIYPMLPGDVVWFGGVDLDNKPHDPDPQVRNKASRIARLLRQLGLSPVVETSQSGRGVHVLVFFGEPMPAYVVRQVLFAAVDKLQIDVPEIFPRQDALRNKSVGNALRLPLFQKSRFVDPKCWRTYKPLPFLHRVVRVRRGDIRRAAHELGCDFEQAEANRPISSSITGIPHVVQQLLITEPDGTLAHRWHGDVDGLTDKSRSSQVFSIACCLVRCYLSTDEVYAAIRWWCDAANYAKGKRDDWIELTIENAYAAVRASAAQWRNRKAQRAEVPDGMHPAIAREQSRIQQRNRNHPK